MNPPSGQSRGVQSSKGLTSAQHEALDAWAVERGLGISDLQQLKDELAHSTSRREEVFGSSEGSEVLEEKGIIGKTVDFFRKHIKGVLIGMGILGGAAGLYVGKQAVDAARKTTEDAVDIARAQLSKEFGAKAEEIQKFTQDAYEIAYQLMVQIPLFLGALQDQMDEFKEVKGTVINLWEGLREDGIELWESRGKDRSPDKVIAKVKDMVDQDPALKTRWTAIEALLTKMKELPDKLGELKDSVMNFDGLPSGFSEATWDRYEQNFRQELLSPFKKKYDKPKDSDEVGEGSQ